MIARILVVRPGALGDMILALPALQALELSHASATLDLVGYPSVLRLVEHAVPSLPVRKVHSIDRALFAPLFSGRMSDELREFLSTYDLVVAWIHDRSGELRAKLKPLSIRFVQGDPYPREGSGIHASQHLLDTLAPLGPPARRGTGSPPRLEAPLQARLDSVEILRGLGLARRGFIAMHPGSGSAAKNWPATSFAALLRMAENAGRQVLVLEGESDAVAVRELAKSTGRAFACLRRTDVLTLTAILSRAGAFVGNDSGVSHLAAATGVPTIAIFGPTDPATWAPRGPGTHILKFATSVENAWGAINRLLNPAGKSPHLEAI